MSAPYRISKLTKREKPLFVSLMSKAFAKDPLFLHVFGDSEIDRKARNSVTAFVSFMFDKSFMLNEEVWGLYENKNLLGVYTVEKPQPSRLQNITGGALLIGRLIPLFFQLSGKTLGLLNSYMRVTRSFAPKMAHHYLIMIGVNPENQGKGIGKALLQHLLHTVHTDNKSQGVALDTENAENVSLYRRFGFALSGETQIDMVPVYCMFYQKKSSGNRDSEISNYL
ncbi:GNAT family N-acetyltransferase [Bacillus sp. CGMCC 1.60114]|uniref:GNAT family N-acetyltransferase n=1 Tax=unclassified Bacillus (in: firmicutes) TaxID=185979 RepID=UPI00366E6CAF